MRHMITGAYFSVGEWVDDWRLAQDFKDYAEAQRCAQEHQLKDVEFHYIYGDTPSTRYDWAMPLA